MRRIIGQDEKKTEELFRIVNGRMESEASQFLEQYNMHICEGEILYIQGVQESGLHRLIDLFSCRKPLQEGQIWLKSLVWQKIWK